MHVVSFGSVRIGAYVALSDAKRAMRKRLEARMAKADIIGREKITRGLKSLAAYEGNGFWTYGEWANTLHAISPADGDPSHYLGEGDLALLCVKASNSFGYTERLVKVIITQVNGDAANVRVTARTDPGFGCGETVGVRTEDLRKRK